MIPANIPAETFKQYLLQNRNNRMVLWITLAAMVVQFGVFKWFYPYPNFLHDDSFAYLDAAHRNLSIALNPAGYSRFLRIFSVFTSSDTILVAFQYLLLQGSGLFLVFTLSYFYRLNKATQIILVCFMVLNPLFLHLANLISSDGMFLALSLAWFSLLLWIIHRPGRQAIIWHTLVVFMAFTVRYNALVYPVISVLAFILSRQPLRNKLAGIGAMVLICGMFVWYIGSHYKRMTKTWQFAPLSGWLIANNGIRSYRYVDSVQRKPVPERFKAIDQVMRSYLDSSRRSDSKLPMDVTLFMYPPKLLLSKYQDLQFKDDSTSNNTEKRAMLAPLYAAYGSFLIRQYPRLYMQHVLWPAAARCYAPPVEDMGGYNAGIDTISPIASFWFGYNTNKVNTRTKDLQIGMLDYYPVFSGMMNIALVCCLLGFALFNGFKKEPMLGKDVCLGVALLLLHAGLVISSTLAVLRFMGFPIIVSFVLMVLLLARLWKMALAEKEMKAGNDSGAAENHRKRVGIFIHDKV